VDTLRQYLLCLIGAALLCSIVTSTVNCTKNKDLIKLLCGLFLLLCLMKPFHRIDFSEIMKWSDAYAEEANNAVEAGKEITSERMLRCIKEELETYILDKAEDMKLDVSVDVTIDHDGIPRDIILYGTPDHYQKEKMTFILESDLGIPKENQIWTGSH